MGCNQGLFPFLSDLRESRMDVSVFASTAERASSNIKIGLSFNKARAIDNLCFCPQTKILHSHLPRFYTHLAFAKCHRVNHSFELQIQFYPSPHFHQKKQYFFNGGRKQEIILWNIRNFT